MRPERRKPRPPKPRPGPKRGPGRQPPGTGSAQSTRSAAHEKPTDWSDVADWYDKLVGDEGSEYHQKVVFPRTFKLLEDVRAKHVLDLACGQGVFSRLLHAQGATVTGVDAARALLDRARDRNKLLDSKLTPVPAYHFGDARSLPFLRDGTFDLAVCILAIQNIDPIHPVFKEVARVLKPGGRFVVVMMHPCFRSMKESHWGWDEDKRVQYRRIDRYLLPRKHPIIAHPGVKNSPYTWTFHKPLEDYIKAAKGAGLVVDALEEWPSHKQSTSGPRAIAENLSRMEIPMFLAIRFAKPLHVLPQSP